MKFKLIILTVLGIVLGNQAFAGGKMIWKGSAILVIKKDKLKEFKKAVSKITKPTRQEKGCIHYEGFQVLDKNGKETNRFEFHELWTTKEAMLIDHKENSPHMKKFFQEIKADTKETYIENFEVNGQYVNRLN